MDALALGVFVALMNKRREGRGGTAAGDIVIVSVSQKTLCIHEWSCSDFNGISCVL